MPKVSLIDLSKEHTCNVKEYIKENIPFPSPTRRRVAIAIATEELNPKKRVLMPSKISELIMTGLRPILSANNPQK